MRENLTQVGMAKKMKVTQSDISQMENGSRSIGRMIAKRIEKLFHVDYRSFLE
jgi:plasmid maintenance system antidote protein VapI